MKIGTMVVGGIAVSLVIGCATDVHKVHDRQYDSKTRTYVYSTDEAGMKVYPKTQGPVDTFRPQYKVGEKKMFTEGVGATEEQAFGNALYKMCDALKCDYVAASRCMYKKIETDGVVSYEAKLVGFPVFMTGVEVVKAKFYEQQLDGTLKPAEPEHKTYFSTNLVWKTSSLIGDVGEVKSAAVPAIIEEKSNLVTKPVKCSKCAKVVGVEKCDGK